MSVLDAVTALLGEHAELEERLADPTVHSDQVLAKRLNQRYAELSALKRAHEEWTAVGGDLEAARELAGEDESFAAGGRAAHRAAGRAGGPAPPPARAARGHATPRT